MHNSFELSAKFVEKVSWAYKYYSNHYIIYIIIFPTEYQSIRISVFLSYFLYLVVSSFGIKFLSSCHVPYHNKRNDTFRMKTKCKRNVNRHELIKYATKFDFLSNNGDRRRMQTTKINFGLYERHIENQFMSYFVWRVSIVM